MPEQIQTHKEIFTSFDYDDHQLWVDIHRKPRPFSFNIITKHIMEETPCEKGFPSVSSSASHLVFGGIG